MVLKEEKVCVTSGKKKEQCSKGYQCSFQHESNDRSKPTPKAEPPSEPQSSKTRDRSVSRKNGDSIKLYPDVSSGAECSFPHWKVEEQPNQTPKQGDDKSAVAVVKSVRQLSCVSQDTEPPDSATISRKGTNVLEPFRRVRFTGAALRQANIREKEGLSLGKIQVKVPHQRSPYAMKF